MAKQPEPPFVKVGRNILYPKDDLGAWLEKHRVHRSGDINETFIYVCGCLSLKTSISFHLHFTNFNNKISQSFKTI